MLIFVSGFSSKYIFIKNIRTYARSCLYFHTMTKERKKLVKLTLAFFIAEIVTGTFDGFKVTLNLHSFNDDEVQTGLKSYLTRAKVWPWPLT